MASNAFELNAEMRERAGKGAARATRRAGRVPAVIYGDKKESVLISIEPLELKRLINTGSFFSHLVDIKAGKDSHRVIARDIQLDPVTDRPLHVDFMRISKGATIAVNVPIHYINEEASPGLKYGGVLNAVRHEVELNVSPEAIPEFIEIDLSGLEVGDSIHISAVALPAGATPTITDRDFTIATIAAPTVSKAVETESEEGAEGETEEGGEE
ncbi:50S ribosomal protein L25/general stress protein Ctc [Magnetovibrio sp.]|uniref:50S ribosomal protein L25/general stress protein Ctc n=1 Tax=Magnetovibrio sp. TaxID=2024836 RepID=UPI002F922F02